MVKLVQMADTHLGYRARRGTINKWAIENYSKPYEQEIYDCFLKVMENISNIKDLDFLIHCGDIFHQPYAFNPYPPPEPARITFKKGLEIFFSNTKNQVPLIYIEGNHGIFKGYEYTPFESHIDKNHFPNLYYFKERDLFNSIKSNQPLSLEFSDKKIRFYLFPYFEFRIYEPYLSAYNSWIETQKPAIDDDFINIAVVHGSILDETLHKKIHTNDLEYDYIALGHEHNLKEVSKNQYYSGSLLPLNFKEIYQNQGYLIIDIADKAKRLEVQKIFTSNFLKRSFEVIVIDINPQQSSADLKNLINAELDKQVTTDGFTPKSSARLKFNFSGEITFEKNWQINELMSRIRREAFSHSEKYNIYQLIWKISDISENQEDDISPGIIQDYILEKPDDEFKIFVKEKLSEDKTNYDIDKLTRFGMKAIKNALKIMEREKEV